MAVKSSTDWPLGVAGPLSELERIRSELDTLFQRFELVYAHSLSDSMSTMNVLEDAESFLVQMDVSRMEEHEIELSATGRTLTVFASQEIRRVDVDATRSRQSAETNTAENMVRFPVEIDPDKMEAKCREGKLVVRLPKARPLAPRKITIKRDD